ncbi:hypothetical protein RYZ20_04700 [Thioclava sp. A2]|uniref:hypothetical protein n=1 Tax=Thioclava sp. FCG-A2 TaxID=3080562 RepID=UPI002952D942|nr:hypothetical protein [Thioclava sp. A2]MDV7270198.1 hypothetical protein [Thioclava sp. A2]
MSGYVATDFLPLGKDLKDCPEIHFFCGRIAQTKGRIQPTCARFLRQLAICGNFSSVFQAVWKGPTCRKGQVPPE